MFIFGCILEIVIVILSTFLPVLGKRIVKSAQSNGHVLARQTDYTTYSMNRVLGGGYYVLACAIVITAIVFIILYITKKKKLIPSFLVLIFATPIVFLGVASKKLTDGGEYVGDKNLSYGVSVYSELTTAGWILAVCFIIALVLCFVGLKKKRKEPVTASTKILDEQQNSDNAGNQDIDNWGM